MLQILLAIKYLIKHSLMQPFMFIIFKISNIINIKGCIRLCFIKYLIASILMIFGIGNIFFEHHLSMVCCNEL
jgi:hypothetical protein